MAATYNPLLVSRRDWLRLNIGDTAVSAPLFQDEELDAVLAKWPDSEVGLLRATAQMARSLHARFASEPDRVDRQDDVAVEWRSRLNGWLTIAKLSDERADAMERQTVSDSNPAGSAAGQLSTADTSWIRN